MSNPIITSLLDIDYYKLTMQQAVFHHYPSVEVEAHFNCRTDVDLVPLAGDIREQIDALADLALTADEKQWLAEGGVFKADYLDWLSNHRLDPSKVQVSGCYENGLKITLQGTWLEVTLFEIYILAIVSELYGRRYQTGACLGLARTNLKNKIDCLRSDDCGSNVNFVDFGTRRRFSGVWHREMLETLAKEVPEQLKGTSNIMLARELDQPVVGTMGHEWLQAHQALVDGDLAISQQRALEVWHEEYQGLLGIALTDTITMDAFLRDFDRSLAMRYTGMRHDSGDAFLWGDKAIEHYASLDVDPRTKALVFSDGLNFTRASAIAEHFAGRIKTSFGIGTWLTNDVGGRPLNIVLKLVSCNGQPVAKISDAPGKTMCLDAGYVQKLKTAYKVG